MGTCCASCLPAKVRDYALDAENGAVTVTVIEDLIRQNNQPKCDYVIGRHTMTPPSGDVILGPVYCANIAKFALSYHQRKR